MEPILEITNLDRNAATRVDLDTADGELHEERLRCMRAITELQQVTADVFANARLLDPVAGDADMGVLRAGGIRYMNSGYSKIYAMTLASVPVYDSRVALEGNWRTGKARTDVGLKAGRSWRCSRRFSGAFPALFRRFS